MQFDGLQLHGQGASVIHDCFELEKITRKERARELELQSIPWSQRLRRTYMVFFSILSDSFLRVISWIYGLAWTAFYFILFLSHFSIIHSIFPFWAAGGFVHRPTRILSTIFHYFWAPVI
jgi:hypothetical protein